MTRRRGKDVIDPRPVLGAALRAANLSAGPRLVALALWAYADYRTGEAYPSLVTIAELSGVDYRHVRRCVDQLEASGIIAVDQRPGRCAVYRFPVVRASHTPGTPPVPRASHTPGTGEPDALTPGVSHTPYPGYPIPHEPTPPKERSSEEEEEEERSAAPPGAACSAPRSTTTTPRTFTPGAEAAARDVAADLGKRWPKAVGALDIGKLAVAIEGLLSLGHAPAAIREHMESAGKPRESATGYAVAHLAKLKELEPKFTVGSTFTV